MSFDFKQIKICYFKKFPKFQVVQLNEKVLWLNFLALLKPYTVWDMDGYYCQNHHVQYIFSFQIYLFFFSCIHKHLTSCSQYCSMFQAQWKSSGNVSLNCQICRTK